MDQAQQLRNVIKKQNQRNVNGHARVITITSGKGGVGKSNAAVNLAVWFQKKGKKVIIFDADFGLANVEVMFGALPKYNLSDLIYRDMEIQEIISEGPMGIGFISGGSGIVSLNNLTKEQITYLVHSLEKLNEMADIIIVDTGAGISDTVLDFVVASPEILLITTPDPSSLTDSYSLLKAVYHNPEFDASRNIIQVVANRTNSAQDGLAVFEKLDSVVQKFLNGKIAYLGTIPQDNMLERSVRQQKPVSLQNPNAKSATAFERIAEALLQNSSASVQEKWGIARLLDKIVNR